MPSRYVIHTVGPIIQRRLTAVPAPKPVYDELLALVTGNDYFVITTNVHHCFPKSRFNKKRLFPSKLVPFCLLCGKSVAMNLRCDNSFLEDDGWYQASMRYEDFLQNYNHLRGEAASPSEIDERSICMDGDVGSVIQDVLKH